MKRGAGSRRCRVGLELRGVVQGVGLRPTIRRLAEEAGVGGWVQNRSGTVHLEVVGTESTVRAFVETLPRSMPPRARLDALDAGPIVPLDPGESVPAFEIRESRDDADPRVAIPPDLVVCRACLEEVFDPASRYYGYPFTTCTDCGPRYTVVAAMPYDRSRTALADFPLCPACRAEYDDPASRRFHAEAIACPTCGPRLRLLDARGEQVAGDPLGEARAALAAGRIVAVKGLGGFLLAVDATSTAAIECLRRRKGRPHKPLAVMARDLATARRLFHLSPVAVEALTSPEGPIVLLAPRAGGIAAAAAPALAPDTREVGVMLPTTPLHALLARPLPGDPTPGFDLLVMTSGNRGGEPICTCTTEALERLEGIADLLLTHDRRILLRCDDSVVAESAGGVTIWRRARGYASAPVRLARPLGRAVLAMGAEMKNTVALGFDEQIVLSPHVGDLQTPEACTGLEQVAEALPRFLRREPEVVAVDLHPEMHATRLGRRLADARGLEVVAVQHHLAHAGAVMAEQGLEQALAVVCDGTGVGSDGAIWGAEVLEIAPDRWRRWGSFAAAPLPGGDAAVRHPGRQLLARWLAAGKDFSEQWWRRFGIEGDRRRIFEAGVGRGLNTPRTHAAGRVFDAYAAAVGIAPEPATWQAQAPIRLEALARRHVGALPGRVAFDLREQQGVLFVDWDPAFEPWRRGPVAAEQRGGWALAFHHAMARALGELVAFALEKGAPRGVVLAGGVMINRLLAGLLAQRLEELGVVCHWPRQADPGDGSISLGQAWLAGHGRFDPARPTEG
ncbi:MAG TPA: carbamoyltransferase HypF [Acidobacteria bacterium]|nr:carbamoyltransferase HypF [Acidobacteriota bacterium]